MHQASITGIGTWLPKEIRGNDAWPAEFAAGAHVRGDRTFNDIPPPADPQAAEIVARDIASEAADPFLGAKRRHVADESIRAPEAEAHAARAALAAAGIVATDVDVILSAALVPERITPSAAPDVAWRIGATRALAMGADAVCASAITQLEIARAYIQSGLAKTVLCLQSHLLLRTVPAGHPAGPGLGDGASAYVVEADKPGLSVLSTYAVTHGDYYNAVVWCRGRTPAEDPPWYQGGGPFHVGTFAPMQVKLLMRDTVEYGAVTIREAAQRAGIDVERISVVASVQPRGFLPGGIAERLGLPRAAAVTTYDRVAHLGACGPVFNLAEARDLGRLKPGTLVALYAQGAGFTRAAAVLQQK